MLIDAQSHLEKWYKQAEIRTSVQKGIVLSFIKNSEEFKRWLSNIFIGEILKSTFLFTHYIQLCFSDTWSLWLDIKFLVNLAWCQI